MNCAECKALRLVLDDRNQVFARAKSRLDEVAVYLDPRALNRACAWVDQARLDCRIARFELERHQRKHALQEA